MKSIETEIQDLGDDGSIAIIYLSNAETRNSMTLDMGMAFHGEVNRLAGMETPPRALVISGKNDVFSSGGDFELLKSFAENTPAQNREFMESFYRLFLAVRDMPFPVIAAVNGHAVGAALALALACDIRYFTPDGKYALNFVRIGIHPGMGSSFLLREVAGLHNAQELLLTGKVIKGEDAYRRGMCHALYSKSEILEEGLKTAREIAACAPLAVRLLKQGMYRDMNLKDTLVYEAESQARNYATEDFREAMQAIGEKRRPVFKDK